MVKDDQSNLSLTSEETYSLFLFFQGLDDLKRAMIMVLAHIYPKQVTATQLAQLSGYSKSSRYIYKSGALESLQKEEIIVIEKPTSRLMLIQLNSNNTLLMKFVDICQKEGKNLNEHFLGKLLEEL
jgi:hypothetical protein